jgi:hypothetical protein
VKAEENAARPLPADEDPFGDLKSAWFELILLAEGFVYVSSEIAQVVDVESASRHGSADSSQMNDWGGEELPTAKNWQFREGVSRVNYRRVAQTDLSRKAGKMKKPGCDDAGFAA